MVQHRRILQWVVLMDTLTNFIGQIHIKGWHLSKTPVLVFPHQLSIQRLDPYNQRSLVRQGMEIWGVAN